MGNFNDKVWYRFLKVVFIITFIVFQFVVISSGIPQKYVYRCNNGKEFPLSYENTMDNMFRLDKACDPNVVVPSLDKNGNFVGMTFEQYETTKNWRGVYVIDYLNALWLLPLAFLGTSLFFWLISRLFFYIFLKDKFISGRLVDMIKRIVIK